MTDLIKGLTIKKALELIASRQVSSDELLKAHFEAINSQNKSLNAVLDAFTDLVSDGSIRGTLAGVPCVVKDNICVSGKQCTAGSKILKNYIAPYDATVITKIKAQGASIIAKTNLDEFAMGTTGEHSAFGATLNPHDISRTTGGSSSGSCAAVASDMAVFALGSDTGGSIRQPAAWCGLVGLKPTYGRVSRHGLIALASGFDQIGPITKTVEDAAIVLSAISGRDVMDATTVDLSADLSKISQTSVKGLRAGVPKEYMSDSLDGDIKLSVSKAIEHLDKLGVDIVEVSLPTTEYGISAYYVLNPAEASSNLARYDGIRYGLSSESENIKRLYEASRNAGFGEEAKRRIMLGTYALSSGYFDAYYLKAQRARTLIRQEFDAIFQSVDIILGPTSPTVATKVGELNDPLAFYLGDLYTVPANLAGLPAISIPVGYKQIETAKLPIGFQIIGRRFEEDKILSAAYALEQQIKTQ